jgi:hypothetical protein
MDERYILALAVLFALGMTLRQLGKWLRAGPAPSLRSPRDVILWSIALVCVAAFSLWQFLDKVGEATGPLAAMRPGEPGVEWSNGRWRERLEVPEGRVLRGIGTLPEKSSMIFAVAARSSGEAKRGIQGTAAKLRKLGYDVTESDVALRAVTRFDKIEIRRDYAVLHYEWQFTQGAPREYLNMQLDVIEAMRARQPPGQDPTR